MFWCRSLMVAHTSSRRPQILTSLPASASTMEKAVPHEPAPKTATLLIAPSFFFRVLRLLGLPICCTPIRRGSKRSAGAVSPRSSSTIAVRAAMIRAVASLMASMLRVLPTRSSRSTGSPAFIVTCWGGIRRGLEEYGGRIFCTPQWPTGITGQPVSSAIRAAPLLPVIGQSPGSRVRVPSG